MVYVHKSHVVKHDPYTHNKDEIMVCLIKPFFVNMFERRYYMTETRSSTLVWKKPPKTPF